MGGARIKPDKQYYGGLLHSNQTPKEAYKHIANLITLQNRQRGFNKQHDSESPHTGIRHFHYQDLRPKI